MNTENEGQLSLQSTVGITASASDQKKLRIRYSRDFFLSLRELDVCKKLPCGLDKSILSDLEEAASTACERQRNVGNSSVQGSRRGEYVSQSLNRSENSSSYTKGSSARWDTRSSGSSDREGDLHPDRESFTQDSGRRLGNQNRRTWQHPEHDGLLGSGALARPGFTGASAPKARGNGQHQLSRTADPYQPPRPYKAAPYSRKDGSDICNDETFGTSECSNEERAEEERKRRESFALMRKEQQKALQEKHYKDAHKGNLDGDLMALLDNSDVDKSTKSKSKTQESVANSISSSEISKTPSVVNVPVTRPLVPPGFATMLMEKNHQMNKLKSMTLQPADEKENPSAPSSVVQDADFGNSSFNTSGLQESKVWEEDMPNDSFRKRGTESDSVDEATKDHSTSIVDKLFRNALVKNSSSLSSDIQSHADESDGQAWSCAASESSKFAHLFQEENEEKLPIEDESSRNLFSLIANVDNFGSQVYVPSNVEAIEKNKSSPPENTAVLSPPISGMLLESYQGDEQRPCTVLTCEDLEQSILAEVEDLCSVRQALQDPLIAVDAKTKDNKDVHDHASHHLLSLLQRGANFKDPLESSRMDAIASPDMLTSCNVEPNLHLQLTDNAAINLSESEHASEKRLTLEALFGAAFMNELHSMEAPVSAQRTSAGRVNESSAIQSYGFPTYPSDGFTLTSNEQLSKNAVFDGEMLQLNDSTLHTRIHKSAANWTGCRDSHSHGFKAHNLAAEQAAVDIHLPEEDSLISLNDSLDTSDTDLLCFPKVNRSDPVVPEKMVGDLSDKFLQAILRVGEPSREPTVDYPAIVETSHAMANHDNDYHHLQMRPTLQFPHQMTHGKPSFAAHLDYPTLRNSQINFVNQDVMHHPHQPLTPNVFAHHGYNNINGPHFDPTARHLLQTMPLSGNFQSHNSVQGLPRAPHPSNLASGFAHEMNLHAFPLHHQQINYGGFGMGMPGHDGVAAGRPSPEALERLMEMEMRANAKQFHPSMADHTPGMYGAELDTHLRYM